MALPLTTSLGDAKEWLRRRVEDGEKCPCCGQFSKVYKRKINSGMARALISMYKQSTLEWFHLPSVRTWTSRDEAALAYFGLIEQAGVGFAQGTWRVTELGQLFVLGRIRVHKYARVYDGRLLGLQGDLVDIKDALGDKFDYEELMSL